MGQYVAASLIDSEEGNIRPAMAASGLGTVKGAGGRQAAAASECGRRRPEGE